MNNPFLKHVNRVVLCGLLMLPVIGWASGQTTSPTTPRQERRQPNKETQNKRPVLVKLSVEQEELAMQFVRRHHVELAELLDHLKKKSAPGYNRGIRELFLAAQRLERYREKQPARFKTELSNWKTYSEIRLLAAKWIMSQDPALEKQIQELLRARQQSKLDALKADRDKQADRLRQMDEQLQEDTEQFEVHLTAEWERLTKQAKLKRGATQTPAKKNGSPSKTRSRNTSKKTSD